MRRAGRFVVGCAMSAFRLATFRVEVTPPIGSPLCGGMVRPVVAIADPLYAIGALLLSDEAPVVLCAVDWCEIDNAAHTAWRDAIAAAAGTAGGRVALHAVHQHNAPLADLEAQSLVEAAGLPALMDLKHFHSCVQRTADAVRAARARARPVDAIAVGSEVVREVASARRILGPDGKVRLTRWSSTREWELRDAPEGLIDPRLVSIAFLGEGAPVACFTYYATHPMSFYGDGVVTSDFAGLARARRAAETPGCEQLFFTGCAGDITAGKYNEGTSESRVRLTGRIHDAMVEASRRARVLPLGRPAWASIDAALPARGGLDETALLAAVGEASAPEPDRRAAALRLAYLRRLEVPISVTRLRLAGEVNILGLPGEPFVEYQLFAGSQPGFTAVAGYADSGTGYLPLARSYAEGGYEIAASSIAPAAEEMVKSAIVQLTRA
jgi:hypothetical protein